MNDLRPLFPRERAALLSLLRELPAEDWQRPTACPGWSVKALALHILDGQLGWLSRGRDSDASGLLPITPDYRAFVDALNRKNQAWIDGAIGLSPRLMCDLLAWVGPQIDAYYAQLQLEAAGGIVSWAGRGLAPVWLDVARDFTELWVHQQQIRAALGRPGLDGPEFLHAVLSTFVWCLPHHYASVGAREGTELAISFQGPGGGEWRLQRSADGWRLAEQPAETPAAIVRLSTDDAWRLFTDALPDTSRIVLQGDDRLARHFRTARAIIV